MHRNRETKTLTQVFFFEICDIFNNAFFNKTLPAEASRKMMFSIAKICQFLIWKFQIHYFRVVILIILFNGGKLFSSEKHCLLRRVFKLTEQFSINDFSAALSDPWFLLSKFFNIWIYVEINNYDFIVCLSVE